MINFPAYLSRANILVHDLFDSFPDDPSWNFKSIPVRRLLKFRLGKNDL
jgi:hypothetical protein